MTKFKNLSKFFFVFKNDLTYYFLLLNKALDTIGDLNKCSLLEHFYGKEALEITINAVKTHFLPSTI